MAYVALSNYIILCNVIKRTKKTFNPLKGETYEFIEDDF